MLKALASAALVTVFVGSQAHAAPLASQLVQENVDERFSTLAQFDVSLPNGESIWGFEFDEAQPAADISIWRTEQLGCQQFGIAAVRARDAETNEWTNLDGNVYDTVAHFRTPGTFNAVEMTLVNDRVLRNRCHIMLRKANFVVPQLVSLLAGVERPTCTPDDQDDTELACTYNLTRIDVPTRDILVISESDFDLFRLSAGAYYRFEGYMEVQDDGSTLFHLTSAQRI